MGEQEVFFDALWPEIPQGHRILVWSLRSKKSFWALSAAQAAEFAGAGMDYYCGVGLASRDHGKDSRCPSDQIAGISGLWADLDYEDGKAHKPKKSGLPLPPDENAALGLLASLSLKPTLVVHSGHGIQAWWLFKEPLIFASGSERAAAAAISRCWQQTIQAKATAQGWSVDSVHDLARVLRIPGTFNAKTDPTVPVRLLSSDGPRYAGLDDFEPFFVEASPERAGSGGAGSDEARGWDFWEETLSGVSEGERDNRITSLNGKLLSLLGDIDSEDGRKLMLQFALLVNGNNSPPLPEEDVRRSFFSILSAEKKRRAALEAEQYAQMELDADDAAAQLGAREQQLEIIARLLSEEPYLPLDRIYKYGRVQSEYVLELKDGGQIPIGKILNDGAVREAIYNFTAGSASPVTVRVYKKADWLRVCRRIAAVAEEVEMPEFERRSHTEGVLFQYLVSQTRNGGIPTDTDGKWENALENSDPFVKDGDLHIAPSTILRWGRPQGIQLDERGLVLGLVGMGFERRKVSARIQKAAPSGKMTVQRVQRRLFVAQFSSLSQECRDAANRASETLPEQIGDGSGDSGDRTGDSGDSAGTPELIQVSPAHVVGPDDVAA